MKDKGLKINVSSPSGHPDNPRTWSGTPHNFLNELKKNQHFNLAFESKLDNKLYKVLNKLFICYYTKVRKRNIGLLGWGLLRYLKSYSCYLLTRKSNVDHTLHFGTLDLPFVFKVKNQKHYLYTDGSWNLWSTYDTNKDSYPRNLINVINKLEKRTYEQMSHIFSISEYVKKDLIDFYNINPSKITVVGTGTGIIKPFYGDKDYKNHKILFVAKGRFKDKGGDIVIEAFNKLVAKNPSYHLSIVGQKEYTSITSHPNISTYGFISIEELQEMFNTHSLFLMPALNEPWGLVYIEAMLCKMPIVGLNRNSFPELSGYGERGVGIDRPDAEILASTIDTLFSQPDLIKEMGLKAQNYSLAHFSWELTVKMSWKKSMRYSKIEGCITFRCLFMKEFNL